MELDITHSTEAYNTIKQEYEQYTINAAQAEEHIIPYVECVQRMLRC